MISHLFSDSNFIIQFEPKIFFISITTLFKHHKGLPITYFQFQKVLKSLIKSIGKDPDEYSSHSFRRGSASWAFSAEAPSELILMKSYYNTLSLTGHRGESGILIRGTTKFRSPNCIVFDHDMLIRRIFSYC
jgi:hypothetical protein